MRGRINSPGMMLKACGVVLAAAVACPRSSAQEQYTFGAQVRLRMESWSNFNFGDSLPDDDDTFGLARLLFHAEWRASERVRVYVQGKTALATDRNLQGGRRTLDVDELDLQNGYIDLGFPASGGGGFTLRAGRQELLFGKERLVSPLDWSNTRRTFDGVSGTLKWQGWTAVGFWTRPAPVRKYEFNETDPSTSFYGTYASRESASAEAGLDVFWLGLERDSATFNGTSGREKRQTLGGRVWARPSDGVFDYDLEAAYQFGEVGTAGIDAFMVAIQLGYRPAESPRVPRLHVGFDYASGDRTASDGAVQTFNQLYPLGHAYLGYIDAIGRQNVVDLNLGLSCKPLDKFSVALDWHNFWRADEDDALYNAGGAASRGGALGSARKVGAEIDLTLKYRWNRRALWTLGYSHFFAGKFIEESGPSDDVDFLYLAVQTAF